MSGILFGTYKSSLGLDNVENIKNNYSATSPPSVTDDASAGYSIGSEWIDTSTDKIYTLVDSTVGAAVWQEHLGGGATNLNDLSDVDTVSLTPAQGKSLLYESVTAQWISWWSPFIVECGRAALATNIWLSGADGLSHNQAPVFINGSPAGARLLAMAITCRSASSCTIEVHPSSVAIVGGVPLPGTSIANLVLTGSTGGSAFFISPTIQTLSFGVFCRGATVDRPRVILFFIPDPAVFI